MIVSEPAAATGGERPAIFVLASYVAACSVSVERLPGHGETLAADDFLMEAGGKGLNVAIGLRRLGMSVDGLMAVGEDLLGTLAGDALAHAGLPAAMLRRHPGRSGAGVGLIDRRGETVIAVYSGANRLLSAEDVAAAGARLTLASHVIAQFEIGDAPIAAAFAMATSGQTTVLNPSPFRPIAPAILERTGLLVVNATEGAALAGSLGLDPIAENGPVAAWTALAETVHRIGVGALVVTRGARDALMWRQGAPPLVQPSFAVACVDGIGAGDAFLAGLVTAHACGEPDAVALRMAAACGALATMHHGVVTALPSPVQLAAFLDHPDRSRQTGLLD